MTEPHPPRPAAGPPGLEPPRPGSDAGEAITRLLEQHGGRIYGLGRRLCGSPEEAEDLVQETFLQAHRKWHTYEGRSDAATWLFTIARHRCQRMHRRRAGEPDRLEPLDQLLPGDATVADLEGGPGADGGGGPYRESRRREAEATVERALAGLPIAFRLPLVLTDIAELSIAEAAEVLGLKPATVKTRVHRARLKLRKALDQGLPQREAARTEPAEVCLSMLEAKQEALDRGVPFPYSERALCERCRAVFATLDLGREACSALGRGSLPPALRERLRGQLGAAGGGEG